MKVKKRTRYKIVGSDYSAQEPRMTAHLSDQFAETINPATGKPCGNKMKDAYLEGKDLYAMIAMSAFDNDYGQNLEFYPPGYPVEIDGKQLVSGKGIEYQVETKDNAISIDWYDLLPTTLGDIQADQIATGAEVISSEGNLTVSKIDKLGDKVIIYFS